MESVPMTIGLAMVVLSISTGVFFRWRDLRHEDDFIVHERRPGNADAIAGTTDIHPQSVQEVCETIFILRRLVIPDLIPEILDLARYWVKTSSARVAQRTVYTHRNAGRVYVLAPIPDALGQGAVRKVVFTTTSRDQGWSNQTHYWGTYEESYTGFEAVVYKPDAYELAKVVLPGRRIVTNVHASRNWTTHVVEWSCDSQDPEIRNLVNNLKGGQKIALTAWVRYPGWHNEVASAQIDIYMPKVRRG